MQNHEKKNYSVENNPVKGITFKNFISDTLKKGTLKKGKHNFTHIKCLTYA